MTIDPRHVKLLGDTMTYKVKETYFSFLRLNDISCRERFLVSQDTVLPR
jgi:hypothetical protein